MANREIAAKQTARDKRNPRQGSDGSLTPQVKAPTRTAATVRNALEALAAADLYVNRLVPHLGEVTLNFREGDDASANEELANAMAGIGFLADLLAAVGRATGIDTLPSSDHELGRLALVVQELRTAQARNDVPAMVAVIEEDLIPCIGRLAPTFPQLEARVAASV